MINRAYICDACDHSFEIQQPMNDPLKKKCPICNKMTLYQDLSGQHSFVYQEPTTLGHLAERNNDKMGKYLLEDKRSKGKKKEPKATWYNPDKKDLTKNLDHLDTMEKKQNYIMRGEG